MLLAKINKGIFHIFNDNNEKVIDVRFEQDLIRKIDNCREVSFEFYRANKTPNLEYDRNRDFVCRYCNFKEICSKE